MRTVSVRQLVRNFSKETQDLPVTVTFKNRPWLVISLLDGVSPIKPIKTILKSFKESVDASPKVVPQVPIDNSSTITTQDLSSTHFCQAPNLHCKSLAKGKYDITYQMDEGEVTKQSYLCQVHYEKALSLGLDIKLVK